MELVGAAEQIPQARQRERDERERVARRPAERRPDRPAGGATTRISGKNASRTLLGSAVRSRQRERRALEMLDAEEPDDLVVELRRSHDRERRHEQQGDDGEGAEREDRLATGADRDPERRGDPRLRAEQEGESRERTAGPRAAGEQRTERERHRRRRRPRGQRPGERRGGRRPRGERPARPGLAAHEALGEQRARRLRRGRAATRHASSDGPNTSFSAASTSAWPGR